MKIAICLSGHMRTYKHVYSWFKKNVIDALKPDIYIHTWKTFGHSLIGAGTGVHYDNYTNEGFDQDQDLIDFEEVHKLYSPKDLVVEDWNEIEKQLNKEAAFIESKRRNEYDVPAVSHLSLWRKIYLCNELVKGEYDLVIRCRPDILFRGELQVDERFKECVITPEEQAWIALSDIFAYSSQQNMNIYSNMYPNLQTIYNNSDTEFNSHRIIKVWLEMNKVSYLKVPINIKIMKVKDGVPFIYHENSNSWRG